MAYKENSEYSRKKMEKTNENRTRKKITSLMSFIVNVETKFSFDI